METHTVHGGLLRRSVRVLVVGCGGTGSTIVGGLPYLHQAMIASGHPGACMSRSWMATSSRLSTAYDSHSRAAKSVSIRPWCL